MAGVAVGGRVVMAADSRMTSTAGSTVWPSADGKVQRVRVKTVAAGRGADRHEVLIATCGSTAVAQAVRHRLSWPALPDVPSTIAPQFGSSARKPSGEDLAAAWREWERTLDGWALDVADAVCTLVVERRIDEDGTPLPDGALLGYDGRLWLVGPWQASRMLRGYEALGSAGHVATGALWVQVAQGRHATDPEDVVRLAVEAAIEWDAGCAPPVQVESLDPPRRAGRLLRPPPARTDPVDDAAGAPGGR